MEALPYVPGRKARRQVLILHVSADSRTIVLSDTPEFCIQVDVDNSDSEQAGQTRGVKIPRARNRVQIRPE